MDAPKAPEEVKKEAAFPDLTVWLVSGYAILPLLFLVVFHLGAGYLSFQKYANPLWAIVDFLFPYFYYPYYAFFLAKEPGPSMGMIGGKRGVFGALKKLIK